MDHLNQLREARTKALARVSRLQTQLHAAQIEAGDLDTAIRVLERLVDPKPPASAGAGSQSENGKIIFGAVGVGRQNARYPKEIIACLKAEGHDLDDDLVRTQLWRMEKRSELRKDDGQYWRAVISQSREDNAGMPVDIFADEKAPGAEATEALEKSGRVAELEVPARSEQHPFRKGENVGSSPTPPSSSAPTTDWYPGPDDLDDDIPF